MDWNKGYSAQYYGMFVDKSTWRDIGRFDIIDGQINIDDDDLRCSASIECANYERNTERWIRIYVDARQGSDIEHKALFTGLACSPSDKINGFVVKNTVDCYSVLKPAEDIKLERGWYAPAEMSGATVLKSLLSVTPAPVEVEGMSPLLSEAIIAEDGETNLSMAGKILSAIDWRLRVTGDGVIHILPKATEVVATFGSVENDAIEPEIEVVYDWYDCPNVFRAIRDDLSGVARDDSEKSMLSTVARGREIWMEETNCDLNTGETIAEYAMRRLKEEQQVANTIKYRRRYNPDIVATDIVELHYPAQNIEGRYKVKTQSIELGHGCTTSEEVVKT